MYVVCTIRNLSIMNSASNGIGSYRDYYFYIEPLTNFHPPDLPVENATVDDVGKYLTCLYCLCH